MPESMPPQEVNTEEQQLGDVWSQTHHLDAEQHVGGEWTHGQQFEESHLEQQNPMTQLQADTNIADVWSHHQHHEIQPNHLAQQNPMTPMMHDELMNSNAHLQQQNPMPEEPMSNLEQQNPMNIPTDPNQPMMTFDDSAPRQKRFDAQSCNENLQIEQQQEFDHLEQQNPMIGDAWKHDPTHADEPKPPMVGAPWSVDAISAGIDQIFHPTQLNVSNLIIVSLSWKYCYNIFRFIVK